MATNNQDFLKFSAYSIKDLITRKLSESTKFTDQVYEGSNLAILIDIFSHMAQCLLYSLNNTAGESMFSDTQIYENMNRLIKFIGYNPKGYAPSTVELTVDTQSLNLGTKLPMIYKYSAIDTGKTDTRGKKIYYSTIGNVQLNSNTEFSTLFYNGVWKLYDQAFTTNGQPYQKFTLLDIKSDSDEQQYVADQCVHVYVASPDGSIEQYKTVTEGIFTDNNIDNGSYIYKSSEAICNLRLNEYKTYELTFGNGFTGKIPPENSTVYVMYLETNGPDAELEPNDIDGKQLKHSRTLFGLTDEMYRQIFAINPDDYDAESLQLTTPIYSEAALWYNKQSSSTGEPEESVEDIRRNAPEWFKTGNRLVTAADYEYYVRNRFRDNVVDVKCQNNWQYISTFYQWLYNLGSNGARVSREKEVPQGFRAPLPTYYVNSYRLQKHDLKFADAADGNNVYLWMKMKNDADIYKELIDEEILKIKCLTQEAVYLKPLHVYFAPSAEDKSEALAGLMSGRPFDEADPSYIEITLADNSLYSSNDIANQAANVMRDFFDEHNFKLGQTVDYSILANQLLNISNVIRLRTIWRSSTGQTRIINGLSFATWTAEVIDVGDDVEVSTVSRTLEPFQFPKLYKSANIQSKIKVIRKSVSNVNAIQY